MRRCVPARYVGFRHPSQPQNQSHEQRYERRGKEDRADAPDGVATYPMDYTRLKSGPRVCPIRIAIAFTAIVAPRSSIGAREAIWDCTVGIVRP